MSPETGLLSFTESVIIRCAKDCVGNPVVCVERGKREIMARPGDHGF